MAGGRPTKYKPEYCDALIEHMSQGLSYQSFAGVIGVSIECLYEWERTYTEFSDAKKEGIQKCMLVWEKIGINGALGKIKNFNSASYIFNMKNRFGWRDKQDIEVSSSPVTINYSKG